MTAERQPDGRMHIRYLDGLRGLAILMVVMIHVSQLVVGMPASVANLAFYGVRGVQLFFIVSGLTLTLSHRDRPLHLPNFAARRFFRIAPMFYAGAILYLILGVTTVLRFAPQNATWSEILATLTFLHGWSVEANNKIVPGGWSIGAEAMFYVVFPLLLSRIRQPRMFTIILIGLYILAGVTYLALRRFLPGDPAIVQGFAFAFWLCQLPAFASGCWLALGIGQSLISIGAARIVAGLAIVAIVIDSQLRGHSNLLVSIALLSLMVWAVGRARPAILESRVMTRMGEISFSLYILHFVIVALLALVAGRIGAALGWAPTFLLLYGITLAVAAPLAMLTFHYIETPFIRFGRNMFRPKR